MLANGQGKGRAGTDGELRARKQWRLLFFSTGELSLTEHAARAGERTFAGMEVRMLQIPSNSGKYGVFEDLHGFANGNRCPSTSNRQQPPATAHRFAPG